MHGGGCSRPEHGRGSEGLHAAVQTVSRASASRDLKMFMVLERGVSGLSGSHRDRTGN